MSDPNTNRTPASFDLEAQTDKLIKDDATPDDLEYHELFNSWSAVEGGSGLEIMEEGGNVNVPLEFTTGNW